MAVLINNIGGLGSQWTVSVKIIGCFGRAIVIRMSLIYKALHDRGLVSRGTLYPLHTLPTLQCRPSSPRSALRVMKNCDVLVFGRFSFAMATRPRCVNLSRVWTSSLKGFPPS